MGNIITLIIFILVLSVIIIIHEFGHLIAAKHFGVYCKEFSIGMGPVLVQKQGKETVTVPSLSCLLVVVFSFDLFSFIHR